MCMRASEGLELLMRTGVFHHYCSWRRSATKALTGTAGTKGKAALIDTVRVRLPVRRVVYMCELSTPTLCAAMCNIRQSQASKTET